MKTRYDFSEARRAPIVASSGKTRITIMLDDDTLQIFRERAENAGKGYQTLINEALREALKTDAGTPLQHSIESLLDTLTEEIQLRRREYEACHEVVSQAAQALDDAVTALEHTGHHRKALERVRDSRSRLGTVESLMNPAGTNATKATKTPKTTAPA